MAVPTYGEDLTDIDLAEATTNYVAYGGGASGLGAGADFSMQGTNCVDKQITNAEKGILFDNGAGITMGTGDHTFIWHFTATPGVTDSLALRGAVVNIGSSSGNFVKYHVEGSDTFGAGGRVGKCYAIDQTVQSANTGSVPYRTLVGTPSGTLQFFGSGLSTNATVKSANMGLDAMRYGTGAYITAGEVANPATFDGFAVQNDNVNNRWGILTDVGGSYELQGRFVVGQDNTKTAALAYFEDSNVAVVFADTVHSAADFTQIIVDHASTTFDLTSCSFKALGTNNPGRLVYNNASTSSQLTTCTFESMGITTLRAGVTLTGCTSLLSDQITQNGATIEDSFITNNTATAAILSDAPNLISDTSFTSDGTGHAIEIDTPGTYTFTGNVFSGYAGTDGSTGNECIYNNSGGAVTINVGGGGDTPTIRNGTSATTTVNNNKTVTFTGMKDNSEVRIYLTSDGSIVDGIEDATAGTTDNRTFAWSAAAGTVVDYVIHNWQPGVTVYESIRVDSYTVPTVDTGVAIQQRVDRNAE